MKIIKVTIKDFALVNGKEYKEAVFPIEIPYSKENMVWAEEHCHEGKPEVFEREEPTAPPSQLDIIEAQVAYTAMMTDTLLEV